MQDVPAGKRKEFRWSSFLFFVVPKRSSSTRHAFAGAGPLVVRRAPTAIDVMSLGATVETTPPPSVVPARRAASPTSAVSVLLPNRPN
jgi:hypothetical protein